MLDSLGVVAGEERKEKISKQSRHYGRRRSLRADTVVGRHGRRGAAIEKVDVVSLNPIGAVETPEKLDPCLRVVGEGPKQPRRLPVSDLERSSNAGP